MKKARKRVSRSIDLFGEFRPLPLIFITAVLFGGLLRLLAIWLFVLSCNNRLLSWEPSCIIRRW